MSLFYNDKGKLRWEFQRFLLRFIERPKVPENERITEEDLDPEIYEWNLPELTALMVAGKVRRSEILDKHAYRHIKNAFASEWDTIHATIKMGILLKQMNFQQLEQRQKHEKKLGTETEQQFTKIEKRVKDEMDAKRRKHWGIMTEDQVKTEFLKDRLKEVNNK